MTNRSYADQLDAAADDIERRSLPEVQALLRRAAMRLKNGENLDLPVDVEAALGDFMASTRKPRTDAIGFVMREWLDANGYLEMQREGGGESRSEAS